MITESWGPGRRGLDYAVALEGPALVTMRFNGKEYRAVQVRVKTRWVISQEDQEPDQEVWVEIIRAEWVKSGLASVQLRDLLEVPAWLEDIITRASPRDVG